MTAKSFSSLLLGVATALLLASPLQAIEAPSTQALSAKAVSKQLIEIELNDERRMSLDFYSDAIFRWFRDDQGGEIRDPKSEPEAQILVDQARAEVAKLELETSDDAIIITTAKLRIEIDKASAKLKVIRLSDQNVLIEQLTETEFSEKGTALSFSESPAEYFYGGGVQNGRFSHKGKIIAIENQNSWTDGGVASPNPFFWSTRGYGLMWHTFKKGRYDFGSDGSETVKLSHETDYLDVFVITGESPKQLLQGYFQLTGGAALLPKFGFYLGHLNAYNRDYWQEAENGILFEDGKRYREGSKENGGIKESLNGENENYQFSARAVIDRYAAEDMPLGWLLPNDGYGAGYGQTDSLEGNVENLRQLGEYARERGVEIGLWTQSDLHPNPEISPLLQRDLVREVRDAGVRVLKTDVAWVGAGYSFGLNGIADAAQLMTEHGDNSRPFIISLDGWAGTQRYAGVWTGDQTGGQWEYIRFHIPTYLGAGLSGMSNICSDMDGIFGGKNPIVNTRDYQWKTFTSMQLNMDGWGANPKYPQALGEPSTSINRWYLKLKSELMPYTYSIAQQAFDGLPMVRPMFLDTVNRYTLGSATEYQFLYGPSFLVAPIYQDTSSDEQGNDIRNNIYLPEGEWIDYFTGELITGGRLINNFDAPIWKLPVFVKRGAIIPKANPHNNPGEINNTRRIYEFYPGGESSFTEYDDDGTTEQYRQGIGTTTLIKSKLEAKTATLSIAATEGEFEGFVPMKRTELQVNLTEKPEKVAATVNQQAVALAEVDSLEALGLGENVFYYEAAPNLNQFATPGTEFAQQVITKNPILHIKLAELDTTSSEIEVTIEGCRFAPALGKLAKTGELSAPQASVSDDNISPYSLTPTWALQDNADYYEIRFEDMLYSTIRQGSFRFDGLATETDYSFEIRAVNLDGVSEWVSLSAKTKADPYKFTVRGMTAKSTAPDQGGSEINKLFDHDQLSGWHTKWGQNSLPFEFIVNLGSVNTLDKLQYLPHNGGPNGTLLKGTVSRSLNGHEWVKVTDFEWERNGDTKEIAFSDQPKVAYLKFEITEAVGGFGSGKELYVFKVPGSASYIPGDINEDNKIDANDLTSYDNYTGLRQGDSDFEGYISKGDVNGNGLIDAFDISHVTTRLEGGVKANDPKPLAGELVLKADQDSYQSGEIIEITVSGKDLQSVNALSFAMPYDTKQLKFEGIEPLAMQNMQALTKDRLHSNGQQALYPTFVNLGEQATLNGSKALFVIKFTALQDLEFSPKAIDGILVDQTLKSKSLWTP